MLGISAMYFLTTVFADQLYGAHVLGLPEEVSASSSACRTAGNFAVSGRFGPCNGYVVCASTGAPPEFGECAKDYAFDVDEKQCLPSNQVACEAKAVADVLVPDGAEMDSQQGVSSNPDTRYPIHFHIQPPYAPPHPTLPNDLHDIRIPPFPTPPRPPHAYPFGRPPSYNHQAYDKDTMAPDKGRLVPVDPGTTPTVVELMATLNLTVEYTAFRASFSSEAEAAEMGVILLRGSLDQLEQPYRGVVAELLIVWGFSPEEEKSYPNLPNTSVRNAQLDVVTRNISKHGENATSRQLDVPQQELTQLLNLPPQERLARFLWSMVRRLSSQITRCLCRRILDPQARLERVNAFCRGNLILDPTTCRCRCPLLLPFLGCPEGESLDAEQCECGCQDEETPCIASLPHRLPDTCECACEADRLHCSLAAGQPDVDRDRCACTCDHAQREQVCTNTTGLPHYNAQRCQCECDETIFGCSSPTPHVLPATCECGCDVGFLTNLCPSVAPHVDADACQCVCDEAQLACSGRLPHVDAQACACTCDVTQISCPDPARPLPDVDSLTCGCRCDPEQSSCSPGGEGQECARGSTLGIGFDPSFEDGATGWEGATITNEPDAVLGGPTDGDYFLLSVQPSGTTSNFVSTPAPTWSNTSACQYVQFDFGARKVDATESWYWQELTVDVGQAPHPDDFFFTFRPACLLLTTDNTTAPVVSVRRYSIKVPAECFEFYGEALSLVYAGPAVELADPVVYTADRFSIFQSDDPEDCNCALDHPVTI